MFVFYYSDEFADHSYD